jgi:hypothetical protein
MKHVTSFRFFRTRVTDAGRAKLQRALPNAEIVD